MDIPGLQTRGIFCCHCDVQPEFIRVGMLWLRDPQTLLGQQVSLAQSQVSGGDRFLVQLPDELPEYSQNVELARVLTPCLPVSQSS